MHTASWEILSFELDSFLRRQHVPQNYNANRSAIAWKWKEFMQTKFWNKVMFEEPRLMEEFQEITNMIFIMKDRKLSKPLKYVEEQRQFSKRREEGRKRRPSLQTMLVDKWSNSLDTHPQLCNPSPSVDHRRRHSGYKAGQNACFVILRERPMTRAIAYLDCCLGIWILLSNSFLTQQWWPTTIPILAEESGTVIRSIDTGFRFFSSTKPRCSPLFAFLLSLAPADGGHWLRPACSQVCWQMWRREPALVSAAWSGQSLQTSPGSQSCSSPIAARRGQKADLLAIDYPEKPLSCNQICEVDKYTGEENPFYFTSFPGSNLKREFGGHFSKSLI